MKTTSVKTTTATTRTGRTWAIRIVAVLLVAGLWTLVLTSPTAQGCGYFGFYRATCVVSGPFGTDKNCCNAANPNMAVDRKIWADHNGGKVYFASEPCKQKFLQSPEKYTASANYQLAVTGQSWQRFCPVTGKTIEQGVSCDVEGVNIIVANEEIKKVIDGLSPEARVAHVFGPRAFLDTFAVRGPNALNAAITHQAQHRARNG